MGVPFLHQFFLHHFFAFFYANVFPKNLFLNFKIWCKKPNDTVNYYNLYLIFSSSKKTTFEEASDGSIELARCDTGYGQPAPSVVWLDQDRNVITTCDKSNVDDLNTKQCITDHAEDNPHR